MKTISLRFHIELPDFHLDMNTHLPNQGITALFGRSGSGKTTLLRAIAGLERYPGAYCAMGPLIWQDEQKNIFLPPHQRSIAYVFQEASLFDHLTVEQNLAYGWKRVPASQRKISLADIHELLDTQNLLQRKPHHLSGGERQRVAIARALLTSPQLILMDEPLAALDFKRKQEILPCIERLRDKMKIPVIYVSHAADEVARLANHIVVIENGTLTAEGPLSDTLARVDIASVFPDEAGVVLETTVSSHEADGLTRLRFADGELLVSRRHESVGKHLRSRIHARDVSIALEKPGVSSILNTFQAVISAMASTDTTGHVLIRLEMGTTPILALITTRSKNALDLRIGQMVWIQVKAVALLG